MTAYPDSDEGKSELSDRDGEMASPSLRDQAIEPDPLPLGEGQEARLPWLEADEMDDEDERGGMGALVRLMLFGVVALGLIVGGIWVLTRRTGDQAVVADGSVIKAPPGPYKEAPKDPGGKKFDGTGDTSFAVSVGQTRPGTLADATPPPQPGFNAVPNAATKPGADAAAGAKPASGAVASGSDAGGQSGVGVQVAAYSSRTAAEAGWSKLAQQYSALSGHSHRVLEGKADIGTVYRVQALAADAAAARALCAQLRGAGLACQVKD